MSFSDHAFVRLELTFEGMRAQVGHMLDIQRTELQAVVDDEIARMKTNTEMLLREQVRKAIASAITSAVEAQRFRIQQIVQPAIEKALAGLARDGLSSDTE